MLEKWKTREAWACVDADANIHTQLMPDGPPVFTLVFDEIRKFKAGAMPVAFTAKMDMRKVNPAGKIVYATTNKWFVRKGGAFRGNESRCTSLVMRW